MKRQQDLELNNFYRIIGKELKRLRIEKAKMGVREYADHFGLHRNTVTNLESGKGDFNISSLITIVRFYGMTLSNFFKSLRL